MCIRWTRAQKAEPAIDDMRPITQRIAPEYNMAEVSWVSGWSAIDRAGVTVIQRLYSARRGRPCVGDKAW